MQTYKIKIDYSKEKEFWFFFTGDHHHGNKGRDIDLLQSEFELAKQRNARIFIGGDWGDFIISGDRKRYHPSADAYGTDNNTNMTIADAKDFYEPYFKYIEMISTGNHEVSMSKFHQFDPTQQLIYSLNKKNAKKHKGHAIVHGQYTGFIILNFVHGKAGAARNVIIYYNHGQGGKAEISLGLIDINRHMTSKWSDIVWLQHKHTKFIAPSQEVICVDPATGIIFEKSRRGFLTGTYLKNINQYDAQEEGYQINYGEEAMRTTQSKGGIFMRITMNNQKANPDIKFEV